MELYIGGYAQGKLKYVLDKTGYGPEAVADGALKDIEIEAGEKKIINRFHEWFRLKIEQGQEPEEIIGRITEKNMDIIIITDEIGNGIVPASAKEREYRERLGRCLCHIAGKADKVERIISGLGQRIK